MHTNTATVFHAGRFFTYVLTMLPVLLLALHSRCQIARPRYKAPRYLCIRIKMSRWNDADVCTREKNDDHHSIAALKYCSLPVTLSLDNIRVYAAMADSAKPGVVRGHTGARHSPRRTTLSSSPPPSRLTEQLSTLRSIRQSRKQLRHSYGNL